MTNGPVPVLLVILDGFGHRQNGGDNAIFLARKPNLGLLYRECPSATIQASEHYVGLPDGQMGNSEVGHLNIGAGRIVQQDLNRIDSAIASGEFRANPALTQAIAAARSRGGCLHVLGLVSDGGVHSSYSHIRAMVEMAASSGLRGVAIHAFLDGRDTPPKSAMEWLSDLEKLCASLQSTRIASVAGRFYAMDRDKHWERIKPAFDAIVDGKSALHAGSALEALSLAYARGETDEFVRPSVIASMGKTVRLEDGDAVVFMNFRSDRARELTLALTEANFREFLRARVPALSRFCSLASYGEMFAHPVAFPPVEIKNGFGEYIAQNGLTQLRIAETEKYAHVTYFFSGGRENPYPGEERILVPSPRVLTYDMKPEMSAYEVAGQLVTAITSKRYAAIISNFANCDMVGHTGNLEAAIHAVEAIDDCIAQIVPAMRKVGGEVLITADHGNAEMMFDVSTQQAHTAHTVNPVPVIYCGRPARLAASGSLRDIAPTLLTMMGLPIPAEMTGCSLLRFR